MSAHVPVSMSIHMHVQMSLHMSIQLFSHISMNMAIHMSMNMSMHRYGAYKFVIAAENVVTPGYVTEKVFIYLYTYL